MDRQITITLSADDNTSYVLTSQTGTFSPPLPQQFAGGGYYQGSVTAPAAFSYGGSCDYVTFEVDGTNAPGTVLQFRYTGMNAYSMDVSQNGGQYNIELGFASS